MTRLIQLGCLLAAALLLGCVTTGSRETQEAKVRKAQVHFDLGVDHLDRGRAAMGLRELLVAETLDPLNPRIHYVLGEAYLRRGKVDESEAHLVKALEIYPEYQDARLTLSAVYLGREKYEQALIESQVLIDDPTFPASWRALSNHGWAAFQLGRLAEARNSLDEALEFRGDYWNARLNLGILEAREGNAVKAVEHFQQVMAQKPGPSVEAEVNYRLAEIFVSLGKRQKAVGHLTTAASQTPGGLWGKKSEEYLKLLR